MPPTQKPDQPSIQDRIIRERKVRERVGLSRSTIWRKIRAGIFPAPIRLGPQSIGWFEAEITAWLNSQRAIRDQAINSQPTTNVS